MEHQPYPSVSVIVATRDRPELLRSTLRAVLAQDYTGDIDVTVVYDQSEPEAGLLDDFPGAPIEVIINTRAPGLAGARNSGVLAAKGDWLAFCDDDDEWMPEKVSAQLALRDTHPRAEVLATGVVIDYDGRLLPRIPERSTLVLRDLLADRVMDAHPSSILVNRSAMLDRIGLVDEEIPGSYGEDYEWILRAARVTEIAVVTRALVRVRWHSASFFADRWRTIVAAIDYLLARVPEFREVRSGHARLLGRQAFALAAVGERKAALAKAWRTIRTDWREQRAYLAVAVTLKLVSPGRLIAWAHARGRGI
jgi:glycosyltransferase involved in cell wall biosynthesis